MNYSTTGLVLLLALPGDIHDRHLDASAVVGFYLPPEVMVEIHPLVLHFAPCRVRPEGFNCLVVLTEGTNGPLHHVDASAPGEAGLLWMRNKWLLCHKDSPQAKKEQVAPVPQGFPPGQERCLYRHHRRKPAAGHGIRACDRRENRV